jgi:hypothetical protein
MPQIALPFCDLVLQLKYLDAVKKCKYLFDKINKFRTCSFHMEQHCQQLDTLPENIRAFWEEKERTLNDTLVRFSYGILLKPAEFMLQEASGIVYLMRQNLWFEDFPKSNAFSALFQRDSKYTKTLIQVPLITIQEVRLMTTTEAASLLLEQPPRPGFFQQLFQWIPAKPNTLLLSGQQADETLRHYAFRDLDDPTSWQQTLSEFQLSREEREGTRR